MRARGRRCLAFLWLREFDCRNGRRRCGRHATILHCSHEAVSSPRNRFDEPGGIGGIRECGPQLTDGGFQAVIEFDESIVRPQVETEFVPGYYLTGVFQKNGQDFEGLTLQPDSGAALCKHTVGEIRFEQPEAEHLFSDRARCTHCASTMATSFPSSAIWAWRAISIFACSSAQLGVLRFGCSQNGNLRISILPQRDELLVRGAAAREVMRLSISASQSNVRQCA